MSDLGAHLTDHLIRAVHRPSGIRIVSAVTTGLGRSAAERHGTSPEAACALSRGLSAGLLLATLTRGGERVTIQIVCDGPLKGLTIDAYDDGDVRGYPAVPTAGAGRRATGHQRLADLLGRGGVVNILRDMGGVVNGDRYQGQVSLKNGEIDEDIEAYLRESEQIPSALGCDAVFDEAGVSILAAGGFLAQVLPGGDEATIREAQHALRTGRLYQALGDAGAGATPEGLARALLPGREIEVLDRRELRFRCRCGVDRIEGMLATLPAVDLDEMIAEGKAEITCNYCNQLYVIDAATLSRLRERVSPRENN